MTTADVTVADGTLRGEQLADHVWFHNVPFAAAPFGANRFKPPQPVIPWDGVRDATGPTVAVPQPVLALGDVGADKPADVFDEDCLVLQIRTPDPGGAGLPVLVWIHGGGFLGGSGGAAVPNGAAFARDGIVHVSINYRLHLDGFLYLGPGTANLGMLDQIAALQWVQDNIAAFGGDPANVTIHGQSAGGVSVQNLLTMPKAQGLFRRVISQSGSSAITTSIETAERFTARFAELCGGVPATVEGFSSVSQEAINQAVMLYAFEYISPVNWGTLSFEVSPFRPVLDGEVIPLHPCDAAAQGIGANVDVLAGSTRDECTFAMFPFGLMNRPVNEDWAAYALKAFDVSWDDLEAYKKGTRPDADQVELLAAAWTDWAFRIPSIRLLEARSQEGAANNHLYEFAWTSTKQPEIMSSHSFELPFVADQLRELQATGGLGDFIGDDAPQSLADTMHKAWTNFATNGDPGWAPYKLDARTTMRFDTESAPVDDLAGPAERELWEGRR